MKKESAKAFIKRLIEARIKQDKQFVQLLKRLILAQRERDRRMMRALKRALRKRILKDKETVAYLKRHPLSRLGMSSLVLTVTGALLISSSLAWLAISHNSGTGFFSAGGGSPLVLHLGTVESGQTEDTRQFVLCENNRVGMLPPSATDNTYSVLLNDMHFGAIDNLARLKPENYVYLRLTVPKSNGSQVHMNIHTAQDTDGYFFDVYRNLYSADGSTVTHQEKLSSNVTADKAILDGLNSIATQRGASFLLFSYAFSATSYEAIPDSSTLTFSQDMPFNEENVAVADCPTEILDTVAEDGSYYLYIKLTPNLDAFAYSIEFLTPLMPCFVLFHVEVILEVLTEESGI